MALDGAISSSITNRSNQLGGSEKVLNSYHINARLAKVVARNFGLGLSFTTQKYSSQQLVQIDTEVLMIGPWSAYYFTTDQPGGIFIQGALYYVNYYEENTFLAIIPPIKEDVKGQGFAGALGFGYTHVFFDRVGLELSIIYNQARIFSELTDSSVNRTSKDDFTRVDIYFSFGFTVLFNRIKNE